MNILSVIGAVGNHGGTSNKLKLLVGKSRHNHFVYLPLWGRVQSEELNKSLDWFCNSGIKCVYRIGGQNIIPYVADIAKIIRNNNIEIVHFYFNFETSFVLPLKLMFPRVRFVRSFVGFIPLSGLKKWVLNVSLLAMDHCVYISKYIEHCYKHSYSSLQKLSSTIIYNAPVNAKRSSIPYMERKLVTYVGGLNKSKNVALLIEMMNIVVNVHGRKDVKLTIIGDGPDRCMIEGLISKYGIIDNVLLLGYRDNVSDYLDNTSVYVHSAINEGFGISVVEAMYMMCPCLLANASALPELIDDTCGFILPLDSPTMWADKLLFLLDHPTVGEEMGREAYRRATNEFSVSAFVNNHDTLYDKFH